MSMKVVLEFECSNLDEIVIDFDKNHKNQNQEGFLSKILIDNQEFAVRNLVSYFPNKEVHPDAPFCIEGCNHLGYTGKMKITIGEKEKIEYKLKNPQNVYTDDDYRRYESAMEYAKKKQ